MKKKTISGLAVILFGVAGIFASTGLIKFCHTQLNEIKTSTNGSLAHDNLLNPEQTRKEFKGNDYSLYNIIGAGSAIGLIGSCVLIYVGAGKIRRPYES